MLKENRWRHGLRDFRFPRLAPNLVTQGCSFYRSTFDPKVGEEVFLFLRDDPEPMRDLAAISPVEVLAHKGILMTPFGVVAYIVWRIAPSTPGETLMETYFNPFEFGTLKLLSDAANQTHLKFVAVDRFSQEVSVMVDFENRFELDSLLFHMVMNIGNNEATDFTRATRHIMEHVQTEDLVRMAVI